MRRRYENRRFVHTHVHTEMSKFDGLAKIAKLVMAARKMGFPAMANTDHGTVGGWVKFMAECNRKKDKDGNDIPYPTIKPMVGCEFYLARDHEWHGVKDAKDRLKYVGPDKQPDGRKGNRHLILLAKNWKGYQNICRLSERSWVDGFYHNPRIDIQMLADCREGVMVQSACLSNVINAALLHDKYDAAKKAATVFKDIFAEDFALEVMYHGIDAEAAIIPDVLKLGAQLGIPVLASNDVHYIEKPMAKSHEILMCMSTNKCVLDPKHLHFPYDEFYLKSAQDMAVMFGHYPALLDNTYAWAERIDAKDIDTNMGGMRLPEYKIPPGFKGPQEYLEHLAWQGMRKLGWENKPLHVAALKKELADVLIAKTNNNYDFATYFLIVWDYINYAREKQILTGCGRGSGYASVLLRTLGITYGPDPILYGLLWERFLGFDNKRFMKDSDYFEVMTEMKPKLSGLAEALDAVEEKEDEEVKDDELGAAEEEEEFAFT